MTRTIKDMTRLRSIAQQYLPAERADPPRRKDGRHQQGKEIEADPADRGRTQVDLAEQQSEGDQRRMRYEIHGSSASDIARDR